MRELAIGGLLMAAGLIKWLPVTGVLGAARLRALYGPDFRDPLVLLLLRHRAVLFGLLGALLMTAAFVSALRVAAIVGGLLSTLSFIGLARSAGPLPARIARIVAADWVASAALLLAAALLVTPP